MAAGEHEKGPSNLAGHHCVISTVTLYSTEGETHPAEGQLCSDQASRVGFRFGLDREILSSITEDTAGTFNNREPVATPMEGESAGRTGKPSGQLWEQEKPRNKTEGQKEDLMSA